MPTHTWTLLTTADVLTATAGDDDIFNCIATTLTAGDTLDGGDGLNRLNLQNGGIFDLSAITLTRVPTVAADSPSTIKIALNQLGGATGITAITGVGTGNTLTTTGIAFDVHSVTISGIQTLAATTAGSTVTVDTAQLKTGTVGGSITAITATGANNALVSAGTTFDVHSVTLSNVQTMSGTTAGTSFVLAQSQVAGAGASITKINATGTGNSIKTADTALTLAGVTVTNVQTLETTGASALITLDNTLLTASGGSIVAIKADNGTSNSLVSTTGALDLRGIALTNVQKLSTTVAGTFTVDGTQLATNGGSVTTITGVGTNNVLRANGTKFDLTGITVDTSITTIQALGTAGVAIKDTSAAHTIVGTTGADTITGGGGADKLTGGGGADSFVDTAANLGVSTITDLDTDDTITITDVPLTGVYVNFSAGTLTVKSNGVTKAAIALTGNFSNNFSVVSSGSGVNLKYLGPLDLTKATSGTAPYTITDGKKNPLIGTYGDDTFVGNPNTPDTVLENGTLLIQNLIVRNANDNTISVTGPNGNDRLAYIDRIRFDDGVLILNPDPKAAAIAGIYQVAYDRLPDEAGLNAQIKAANANVSLLQLATNFLNSKEAAALALPSLTNTAFVTMLYDNSFGRAPDAGGLQVQLNALAQGVSRAQLLLNFATSAEELAIIGAPLKGAVFAGFADPTLG
ncbi:DUF4214 domain-containing protein [Roseiterribacter gracilis]|uniref:DUF4214 domain-containing protein n=1 Tax=Roseiterribacter gracilis TaxID=2812848 RepID=A0A8S8XDW6_9PROT|nr:hypothetical protein TMPK1_23690 [Rhodospirillales bacterium TMPK1]